MRLVAGTRDYSYNVRSEKLAPFLLSKKHVEIRFDRSI